MKCKREEDGGVSREAYHNIPWQQRRKSEIAVQWENNEIERKGKNHV